MIVTDQIYRDEPTHTYWRTEDQTRVVGYSEMIRTVKKNKGFGTEEDLIRGKNVHLAVHYFEKGLLGQGPGLDESQLSPRILPFFQSYKGFFDTVKPRLVMTEVLVYDPVFHLACQLDSIWMVQGVLTALDYKSGGVQRDVKYQTAAHINGLELPKKQPFRRWGLELRSDGKPARLTEFNDPSDMIKVQMFTSVFYTLVNDGDIKWPRNRPAFERQRRQANGDDLFASSTISATVRDSETETGEIREPDSYQTVS